MTTAFPLLRLPHLVLMPILEQMEFMERIALSIYSKRARMYVRLLKMKCNHIDLRLEDNRVEMKVFFDNSEELKVDMDTDRYKVDLRYGNDHFFWWPGTLSPIDYVLSIMDVTHCKSIKQLTFPEVSEYDPKYDALIPLLTKLPKIDEVIVEDTTSWSFSPESPLLNVLRIIFPVTSAVTISGHIQKPNYLREIFKGNFDAVSVSFYLNNDEKFSLNDWKFTNAKTLKLAGPAFEVEDLNRYFKLWMKKKCNPRLENLVVRTRENVTKDLLLKGLNAVQVPIRTDRSLGVLGSIKQYHSDEKINWEFDITRADGRIATISISNHRLVCFYVSPFRQNQSSFMRRFSSFSSVYNSCIEHFK
ncbi:hypothetical protein CRE_10510 [Caenorhabditis remanei]|uniref:F-box domain-containing protein n=1 Tax=Caenorhabditis remanei TaxID=31234 RepID=E3N0N1_CAERE|nr:hypothetical protein CRE_10510 [Caenorhabditis remanei]